MKSWLVDLLLVVGAVVGVLPGIFLGGGLSPIISPSVEISRATYVYEKDDGGVPLAVEFSLNEIDRAGKVDASVIDDDVQDASGSTPPQYKIAVTAAREAGLPALVVQAGEVVVKTVRAPTTEEQVKEAVQ